MIRGSRTWTVLSVSDQPAGSNGRGGPPSAVAGRATTMTPGPSAAKARKGPAPPQVHVGDQPWSRKRSDSMGSTNELERSTQRPDDLSIRSRRSGTWAAVKIRVGQLAPSAAGHEHPARLVDPTSSNVGSWSVTAAGRNRRRRRRRPVPPPRGPATAAATWTDPLVVLCDSPPRGPCLDDGDRADRAPTSGGEFPAVHADSRPEVGRAGQVDQCGSFKCVSKLRPPE